jgi:hypothetical protein
MDTGSRQPTRRQIDPQRPPDILDIEIRRVHYSKPRPYVDGTRLIEMREGIEVSVQTTEDFPIRALSPIIFIGEVPLTESERVREKLYRFYFPYIERLKEGDPIFLGWTRDLKQREPTRFIYKIHLEETK